MEFAGANSWIVLVTQQSIQNNRTLLRTELAHYMAPTEGLRLLASWAFGRHPRPDFEPKVQTGEPTGTAIDDHERQWRADAVINGGSKTV